MILSRELDPGRSLRLLSQVADALDTAHDVGLTHRDIKPQNILIGARDHAFLADFGLTKAPDEAGRLTGDRPVRGDDRLRLARADPGRARHRPERRLRADRGSLRMPDRTGAVPEADRGRGGVRAHRRAAAQAHRASPGAAGGDRRGGGEGDGQGAGGPSRLGRASCSARSSARSATRFRPRRRRPARWRRPRRRACAATLAPTQPAQTADTAAGRGGRGHRDLPGRRVRERRRPRHPPAAPTAPAAPPAARGPPAPPARTPARAERRPIPLLALAAGLGLVAAIAGFLLGGLRTTRAEPGAGAALPPPAPSASRSRMAGSGCPEQPDIPGMRFSQPIVAGAGDPRRPARGGSGRRRRPDAAAADLPRPASKRARARRAGQAGSARGLPLRGPRAGGHRRTRDRLRRAHDRGRRDGRLRSPPASAAEFAQDCERVAASLQLTGAKPLALGPSEAYAKERWRRVRAARLRGRRRRAQRLRRARTPAAQAAAARALASAYRSAASARLGGAGRARTSATPEPPSPASLRAVGDAYARAAAAARGGDRGAYAAARRSVRRAGQRARALAAPPGGARLPGRIAAESSCLSACGPVRLRRWLLARRRRRRRRAAG